MRTFTFILPILGVFGKWNLAEGGRVKSNLPLSFHVNGPNTKSSKLDKSKEIMRWVILLKIYQE